MSKRKTKKPQRRPITVQQVQQQLPPPALPSKQPARPYLGSSPKERRSIWRKTPRWLWTALSTALAAIGLYAVYPTLSINDDYSFDTMFPYNTSFSITNEGFWPIADLAITCGADFVMRPWTADPSDRSSMNLHTESSEYKDFAKILTFKHRLTLPCNHNVVANGHRIDPGAKPHIKIVYRLWGTKIKLYKTFDLSTVEGWYGQQFWQYQ